MALQHVFDQGRGAEMSVRPRPPDIYIYIYIYIFTSLWLSLCLAVMYYSFRFLEHSIPLVTELAACSFCKCLRVLKRLQCLLF